MIAHFKKFKTGEIGLSSVVAAELACGIQKTGSARNKEALKLFLAPLFIDPFDESCVWAYGELRAQLEKIGQPIGSLDTLIAAHALAFDTVLVTNNQKEFARVPGLRLENWAI